MKKLLILLFLSLSLSSPAFADKAYDLYQAGDFNGAAAEWLKKARNGSSSAQFNVGVIYSTGEGVPKDLKNSFYWYEKSAKQGNKDALNALGKIYYYGTGLDRPNYLKAYENFLEASKKDNANSYYFLGRLYEFGDGVTKNLPKALTNYRTGALAGVPAAQYRYGTFFESGKGGLTESNFAALKWYEKSANQGYESAKSAVTRVKAALKKQSEEIQAKKELKALQDAQDRKKRQDDIERRKAIAADKKQLKEEKLYKQKILWGSIAGGAVFIWILIYILGGERRDRERQLRMDELARIADRKKKEEERIQREKEEEEREKEEEERRIRELAIKEEEERIYALQQKKLVYLKADKYLSEFESHLPFKLSANYSDLRVFYDEESSTTQTSLTENQTSFKDGKLWDALISLLVDDHSLDTMSTIYFAKIRSLLDDENYLVIGETDLDINEFFDRSTQLELVDLISSCLMPKPIALFVILHLSREFRYPNEEERAETEFKLEHFIVKENAKVKIQKLFTKFDEYAIKCVDSYADISSKEYDELESNEIND